MNAVGAVRVVPSPALRVRCWLLVLLAWLANSARVDAVDEVFGGTARVDLTPPLSLKAALGGYGERLSRPATGVHDRVWAKALFLRQADRRIVLVTADVLAFPPGFKAAVQQRLAAEGWREDEYLLLASHSHTSLDMAALHPNNTFNIPQIGIYQPALLERTAGLVAQVIRDAAARPVAVRSATRQTRLNGWNRNRRGGPATDPDLSVTRFDSVDGQPLAAFVNWTAHPTFMTPVHMEFSGDWPGHLQRTLEALIGGPVTVLYCNGAEGDQSPVARVAAAPPWEQAERYGRELAVLAWQQWTNARPAVIDRLEIHRENATLPPRRWHPDFLKTGGAEYGMTEANVGALVEKLVPTTSHSLGVRCGDLVLVGVPGEMAAGLGLGLKARLREKLHTPHVVLGGLADEWISYILEPDQWRRGGYEASVSFYGDSLGPELVETLARGAAQLSPAP